MPFTISSVAYGLWKFAVPTATALAPARINSIASSAFMIPPMPMIGTETALETSYTMRRAIGLIPAPETQVAHLDKSHVTVHTYPEYHPETSLATFRVDIDVATCGEITPLSTLDYLIGSFDSDIITMDYRVRGFTRSIDGKKVFNDGNVTSIQEFISPATLKKYDAVDINVYAANLFHTKMLLKEIDLQNYLFNRDAYEIAPSKRLEIIDNLRREMIEIFNGQNIY